MSLVIQETIEQVGIITLNNASKVNCLSLEMVTDLVAALDDFKAKKLLVVILRAPAGAKVWSAGHDIRELPRKMRDPLGYFDSLETLLREVEEYPGAIIGMIQGSVWGGACDLIMTCDMVIGDQTAAFAITPAKLGLPYNATGIMHFMNRLPLNLAKEMFFTAELIAAQRAFDLGILNHLVASNSADELLKATLKMANTIVSRSSLSIQIIKEQFRIRSKAYALSPSDFERIQGLRRRVYDSRDYEEAITSFLEKRTPVFLGE